MLNTEKIRADFKVLREGKNLVYFDSACMSLKPDSVVKAITEYYEKYPACGGRSSHKMADTVTKKMKETRKLVAEFIGARDEREIVFTRNTTESINLLANSLGLMKGDKVLITDKEHNSNLVPWLYLRDKVGIEVVILPSKEDNTFDLEKFSEMVQGIKLVSVVHTSNLDGVTNPAEEIIEIAHKVGALVHLDAAQSIAHQSINVKKLDVDFLSFSGHKMLGPTGTGVFYGKYELLKKLSGFIVGGDTVFDSKYDSYELLPPPERFEAGLQDYAGIIGLSEAVKYLSKLDFKEIKNHELELNTLITEAILKLPKVKIIGPADPALRSGIVNFYVEGKDMQQIGVMLDELAGIAVRTGRHCVHSWYNAKGISNSTRVSAYIYNTREEAEIFIKTLEKILKI